MLGAGVAGAIRKADNGTIQRECDILVSKHGGVPAGRVAITSGGELRCDYVIHAVGPMTSSRPSQEEVKLLRGTYNRSLRCAARHGCKSIALPAISTGIFGFPKPMAAPLFVSECLEFCSRNPDSCLKDIRLVNIDSYTTLLIQQELTKAMERATPETDPSPPSQKEHGDPAPAADESAPTSGSGETDGVMVIDV